MTFIPLTLSHLLNYETKGKFYSLIFLIPCNYFFFLLCFSSPWLSFKLDFMKGVSQQMNKVEFSVYICRVLGFFSVVVVVKSEVKSRYSPCIHGWCLYWTPFALGSSLSRNLISDLLYENQCYYCKVHLVIKFQITALGI